MNDPLIAENNTLAPTPHTGGKEDQNLNTSNQKVKLTHFDWAMKNLLGAKANFEVLEGFLLELLQESVKVIELLESESNK